MGGRTRTRGTRARRATNAASRSPVPSRAPAGASRELALGVGRPLPESTRSYFEPRFGHDFGRVRVHADSTAAASARALGANAFTTGHRIAFDEGRYLPQTTRGRRLLAHELAHVVQQSRASTPRVQAQFVTPHSLQGGYGGLYNLARQRRRMRMLRAQRVGQACFDGRFVYVVKNNHMARCSALTGNVGRPTPSGLYCVRRQGAAQRSGILHNLFRRGPSKASWHLIEPQFSTRRYRMHLHPGSASSGCITVRNTNCYWRLSAVLNQPGVSYGVTYNGYPPGNAVGVRHRARRRPCVAWLYVQYGGCGRFRAALRRRSAGASRRGVRYRGRTGRTGRRP